MYINKSKINTAVTANGGSVFIEDRYWSSSEIADNYAWRQYFNNSTQSGIYKGTPQNVRAVRAFSNSLAGAQGIQGATGSAGADGANGANGEKGATGDQGSQGTQGETGSAGADGTQPTYTVNTFYPELGGYVIAVRDGGKHGLVVAMQDQGRSNWYGANDLLSDANNHDVNGAKFMDWRLPTKRELNLMFGVYIGGNGANLNSNDYWCSTEYAPDDDIAWIQEFSDGFQNAYNKSYYRLTSPTSSVRAVRAF
jgi:hypothetical protein